MLRRKKLKCVGIIAGLLFITNLMYWYIYFDYGNKWIFSKIVFNAIQNNEPEPHLLFNGKKIPVNILLTSNCNQIAYEKHYKNKDPFYEAVRKSAFDPENREHWVEESDSLFRFDDIKLLKNYTALVVYNSKLKDIYYDYYGYDNERHHGHVILDEGKRYRGTCNVFFFKENKGHILFDPA